MISFFLLIYILLTGWHSALDFVGFRHLRPDVFSSVKRVSKRTGHERPIIQFNSLLCSLDCLDWTWCYAPARGAGVPQSPHPSTRQNSELPPPWRIRTNTPALGRRGQPSKQSKPAINRPHAAWQSAHIYALARCTNPSIANQSTAASKRLFNPTDHRRRLADTHPHGAAADATHRGQPAAAPARRHQRAAAPELGPRRMGRGCRRGALHFGHHTARRDLCGRGPTGARERPGSVACVGCAIVRMAAWVWWRRPSRRACPSWYHAHASTLGRSRGLCWRGRQPQPGSHAPFFRPPRRRPPPASTPTPQGTTRTHNPHTRALPHPLRRTPNHPRTDTPRPPENMRLCGLLLLLLLLAAAPSTQVAAKRSRSKRPRARTSKKALAKAAREAETTEQAAFIEALQRDASAAAVESWLRPALQAALDSTGGDLSESACTGARLRRLGSGSGRR